MKHFLTISFALLSVFRGFSQMTNSNPSTENWISSPGVIGTAVLLLIVVVVGLIIFTSRVVKHVEKLNSKKKKKQNIEFSEELIGLSEEEIDEILERRKQALNYKLSGEELGSGTKAKDEKGLISSVTKDPDNPLVDEKKNSTL